MTTTGNLQIHSENILPIIKRWLYSDKDIFIRELVSNATDALQKWRVLSEKEHLENSQDELAVNIKIDKEKRTLTVSDSGIGMTEEEVIKYIAQVAFSSAEEFMEKYQSNNEQDQIIGHFGLGFYSAYMVADKVEIDTLSYREGSTPAFWTCDGGSEYTLAAGTRTARGTDITLHIGKEHEEYLEEHKIETLLKQYCRFLPYPIYLNGRHMNPCPPLWLKSARDCSEEEYLEFYRELYPAEPDPLFWIHLDVDYPFNLKGILYFPHITRDFDYRGSKIHLFCNRVFICDTCKDIIPEYLMPLRGAIDSRDIPLNVSRSSLQLDKNVRQLAAHVSKKVADRLNQLYSQEKERFQEVWNDIQVLVKVGAMEDDKFYDRVKDLLIWKNTSEVWTSLPEYLERQSSTTVFYALDDRSNHAFLELYEQQKLEVLLANPFIDPSLFGFLERKMSDKNISFQRIDGGLNDSLIDKEREKTVLDADGKTQAAHTADFFRRKLGLEKVDIEAKSLASDNVAGFVMIEESSRRMRDFMARYQAHGKSAGFEAPTKKTFIINTNSPLVQAVEKLDSRHPELASELAVEIYELSLLSQNELEAGKHPQLIQRSLKLFEKLATELNK